MPAPLHLCTHCPGYLVQVLRVSRKPEGLQTQLWCPDCQHQRLVWADLDQLERWTLQDERARAGINLAAAD